MFGRTEVGMVLDPAGEGVPLFEYWRPTRAWVSACQFRLLETGIAVCVLREGDSERGAILIILAHGPGRGQVLAQVRSPGGQSQWTAVHTAETLVETEIEQAVRTAVWRDPDLWVLLMDGDGLADAGGGAKPFRPRDGVKISIPDALRLRIGALSGSESGSARGEGGKRRGRSPGHADAGGTQT